MRARSLVVVATAKRIVHDLAGPSAVTNHASDQLNGLGGRVQIADHRPVDLEHRILRAVLKKVVRTVLEPVVEDGLMPIMIIRHTDYEVVFDPDQQMLEGQAGTFKSADKIWQQSS